MTKGGDVCEEEEEEEEEESQRGRRKCGTVGGAHPPVLLLYGVAVLCGFRVKRWGKRGV